MTTIACSTRNRGGKSLLTVCFAVWFGSSLLAAPRPPMPPLPETVLTRLSFDEGWNQNVGADMVEYPFGVLAASWNGFALERDVLVVSPFVLPGTNTRGKALLPAGGGAIRFWFNPSWSSAPTGGNGPGHLARLLELVTLDSVSTGFAWSLYAAEDGNTVYLTGNGARGMTDLLTAKMQWEAGRWYLLTLSFTAKATQLYVNDELIAEGDGLADWETAQTGLVIGSDLAGNNSAGGLFDELTTFAQPLNINQLAFYYHSLAATAELGPVAPQETAARLEAAQIARAQAAFAPALMAASYTEGQAYGASLLDDCEANLIIESLTNAVRLTVTNATAGVVFDLFRTLDFFGNSITNSWWYWTAKATNGQVFTFSNSPCNRVFYVLGCTNDSDADGLTDAFELLVHKTSPLTNHSVNALYTDLQMVNVLVNSPDEDCGNEQNTQFESTCAVLGSNVIVGFVDSNQGVYGLGSNPNLTNRTPRMVAYAVSTNGGLTFEDRGLPPLSRPGTPTNDDGDAGDPWLAADRASQAVYLVGTSPRNAGNYGIPLWRSTNSAITFTGPTNVLNSILASDKPSVVVDDWPGLGQHDVYVMCTGTTNVGGNRPLWLAVSTNGSGGGWTNAAVAVKVPTNGLVNSPIILVGSNHLAYAFWFERANSTNYLMMRTVSNRGTTLGGVRSVRQLATTNSINGNLELKRNNSAAAEDQFRAWPFPVPAINPAKTGHLYVAYADKGDNIGDKADIFLVASTNNGDNWTSPLRVNTIWTNDQWMPVLAVKPDGTKLFMAWYDRRNDTNNGAMGVYGRWGSISTNGTVTLNDEFRITPVNFPHVFSGTDTNNLIPGLYDPVYPPGGVNLIWWYPEWPNDPDATTSGVYANHVGEYNGVWGGETFVHFTWTDNRRVVNNGFGVRNQSDIRQLRIAWPNE